MATRPTFVCQLTPHCSGHDSHNVYISQYCLHHQIVYGTATVQTIKMQHKKKMGQQPIFFLFLEVLEG